MFSFNKNIKKYGFDRRRTTGHVDTSKVYDGGRYLIGPDHEFKEFYAASQFVHYKHIPIFTKDNLQVFKYFFKNQKQRFF
jgi:hypothetical protein